MKQNKLNAIAAVIFTAACCLILGCSKMDGTYKDFIKDGPVIYVGRPDSLQVHPGRYRLKLSWLIGADPKVRRAKIYWNNRKDSVNVEINGTMSTDSVNVMFDNMSEGSYVFEIYTFDDKGHSSVKTEIIGNVYGENYQKTLLIRPIYLASIVGGDTARIDWGAASYKEAIASEMTYTDLSGISHHLVVSSDILNTVLENVEPGVLLTYRTWYLPSPVAVDTFYTDYQTVKIKGPPVEVTNKNGWRILDFSSEDVAGNRRAANLIDGNVTNLYVNKIDASINYPHTVSVDMGGVMDDIEGFTFYQRNINQLKTVEIKISMDGLVWESLGDFTLSNTPVVDPAQPQLAKPVYAQLSRPRSFRYFREIYKNDYANSKNVNIHEIGVYTRF